MTSTQKGSTFSGVMNESVPMLITCGDNNSCKYMFFLAGIPLQECILFFFLFCFLEADGFTTIDGLK